MAVQFGLKSVKKIKIISSCVKGFISNKEASIALNLSYKHFLRLKKIIFQAEKSLSTISQ
jgi:hypothetical protein